MVFKDTGFGFLGVAGFRDKISRDAGYKKTLGTANQIAHDTKIVPNSICLRCVVCDEFTVQVFLRSSILRAACRSTN